MDTDLNEVVNLDNDTAIVNCEIEQQLMVGSTLVDLERVYLRYCDYAHKNGFSVRKGDQRYFGRSNEIRLKEYVCSCEGFPDCKASEHKVAAFKKTLKRTDCKANIRVIRESSGGPWIITLFKTEHNHPLLPPDQTFLLRSARQLSFGDKSVLEALHSSGIGVSQSMQFMTQQSGGSQSVGFTMRDAYNHIQGQKRVSNLPNSDSNALLEFFTKKSKEEPEFFWRVQSDDDGRLLNFFFRDSRSAIDYELFGDVLSVDTTYRTNRYNLSCAPFVGINHHTSNVMFGMGFLSKETTSNFEWLFSAFLESMNGRQPKVVFSDQCLAMMNAIDSIFTSSKHRLCQWHISKNAPSHFGKLKGDTAFLKMWNKCMNNVETVSEFDELWSQMMHGFQLCSNEWFVKMYDLRHRWASVFTNGIFTAGLLATSRSEVTNKVLKSLSRCSSSLYDFVMKYDDICQRWRANERAEDMACLFLPGQMVANNRLLTHAASVYTRTIFKSFQAELTKALNVELEEVPIPPGECNMQFKTVPFTKFGRFRSILFNKTTHAAWCSCRMWETEGLFCRHILRVYIEKYVHAIPLEFILRRWSRRATNEISWPKDGEKHIGLLPYMTYVSTVTRRVQEMMSVAKDNEAALEFFQTQFNGLYEKFSQDFGLHGVEKASTMEVNTSDVKFEDPKIVKPQGSIKARLKSHWESNDRKGKKKAPLSETALRPRAKNKNKKGQCSSRKNDLNNLSANVVQPLEENCSLSHKNDVGHRCDLSRP